ncbi:hypothetical protein [uncultured Vibrio sp.]|uniref:hypothetical protein n=1 Tax=uncultured Vibrio sp. TaxID=114054 RepID=UPI00262F5C70|nr:hypothetical protein [uncultured Vibrio sp.]
MSSLRKLQSLENIKSEQDVRDFLVECQDKDTPLYYKVPPAHHVWHRVWWSQSGRFSQSLNINISIEKNFHENTHFVIKLDKLLISNLIGFGFSDFFSSSKAFYYNSHDLKSIIDIPITELWNKEVERKRNELIKIAGFELTDVLIKCVLSPEEYVHYLKNRGNNKPAEAFYFKDICNEKQTDNYSPKEFRIFTDEVYILDKDLDEYFKAPPLPPLKDIPKSSPYYIPEHYRNNKILCKLARIGFGIFELKTIKKPKKVCDGRLLLRQYNLFKQEEAPSKIEKLEESGYAFINMGFGKIRKEGKVAGENPQIQYLIFSQDTYEDSNKVEFEIDSLTFSDEMTSFAKYLIIKKE